MRLLEVEFKGRRKGVFDNPQEFPIQLNDMVVVQADRGEDLGRISLVGESWQEKLHSYRDESSGLEPVIRLARQDDLARDSENRLREQQARPFFLQQVRELNLDMKLVDIEYQLDGRKLTFYFTAEARVDFRELVKVLAQHFRTRIDLRQIGARDEARRIGGIGLCGRELCCATWIREFRPVTTSMLKEQNLLLNPQKNTGLCGKLRCCLRFEVDQYREVNQLFPKVDTKVSGPRGNGVVEKISMCHSSLGVRWEDGARIGYSFEQLRSHTNWDPQQRDSIRQVEFSADPSLVVQEREEREGRLIASYDASETGSRVQNARNAKSAGSANRGGGSRPAGQSGRDKGGTSTRNDTASRKRGRGVRGKSSPEKPKATIVTLEPIEPGSEKEARRAKGNAPENREDNSSRRDRNRNRPNRSRGRRGKNKQTGLESGSPPPKQDKQPDPSKDSPADNPNPQSASGNRSRRGGRRRKR